MPNRIIYTLTLIELFEDKEKFPELEIFLDNILKNINVIESVKDNINNFLLNIIIPAITPNKSIIKLDMNEKELRGLYRRLIINSDKFEKLIIRTIYDIDVTKVDFIKKNWIEKIITNVDIIDISIKEIELTMWLLLYSKDKERIRRYKQYVIDLIKDTKLKILEIYQNYIIDYVSYEEQRELEEDLKDI